MIKIFPVNRLGFKSVSYFWESISCGGENGNSLFCRLFRLLLGNAVFLVLMSAEKCFLLFAVYGIYPIKSDRFRITGQGKAFSPKNILNGFDKRKNLQGKLRGLADRYCSENISERQGRAETDWKALSVRMDTERLMHGGTFGGNVHTKKGSSLASSLINGRDDWIWTSGLLLPKQTRYQAALRPEISICHCFAVRRGRYFFIMTAVLFVLCRNRVCTL